MAEAKSTAYGADLAYIHHTAFGEFARNAATGILNLLNDAGIASGMIVDLGCGSGIFARELLSAGFSVYGVDISPAMIALARETAPAAKFVVGSLLRAPIPRCAAVTAVGECLNYAFDRKNNSQSLARLFQRVYRALEPGGVFIFDAAGAGRLGAPSPLFRFIEGDGWTMFVRAEEDTAKMTLTRRIITFRKTGDLYRRSEELHKLNLYRSRDTVAMLRKAGFRARTLAGYGDFRLSPSHTVYVARCQSRRHAGE